MSRGLMKNDEVMKQDGQKSVSQAHAANKKGGVSNPVHAGYSAAWGFQEGQTAAPPTPPGNCGTKEAQAPAERKNPPLKLVRNPPRGSGRSHEYRKFGGGRLPRSRATRACAIARVPALCLRVHPTFDLRAKG